MCIAGMHILSVYRLFGGWQSFFIGVGTCVGGYPGSAIASQWHHRARIDPGDGFVGAFFPLR